LGRLILPEDARVYADANAVIYHVERLEPYRSMSAAVWEGLERGRCRVETSELTLLEVLVKPVRDGNEALASLYREVLTGTLGLSLIPIDRETLELAARLRAEYRLRTPDAIHAATASRAGASIFFTNDLDFRRVAGLDVIIIGEIEAEDRSGLRDTSDRGEVLEERRDHANDEVGEGEDHRSVRKPPDPIIDD